MTIEIKTLSYWGHTVPTPPSNFIKIGSEVFQWPSRQASIQRQTERQKNTTSIFL